MKIIGIRRGRSGRVLYYLVHDHGLGIITVRRILPDQNCTEVVKKIPYSTNGDEDAQQEAYGIAVREANALVVKLGKLNRPPALASATR